MRPEGSGRRIVRGINMKSAQEAADEALAAENAERAEHALRARLTEAFGDSSFLRDG